MEGGRLEKSPEVTPEPRTGQEEGQEGKQVLIGRQAETVPRGKNGRDQGGRKKVVG